MGDKVKLDCNLSMVRLESRVSHIYLRVIGEKRKS
jgi:hypothetical protein